MRHLHSFLEDLATSGQSVQLDVSYNPNSGGHTVAIVIDGDTKGHEDNWERGLQATATTTLSDAMQNLDALIHEQNG